jgi:hypothetical protein
MNRFLSPIGGFAKKILSSKPVTYTKNQSMAPQNQSGSTTVKAPYTLPKVTPKPQPKPTIPQYGDKRYRPSTGKGVGH